MPISKYTEGLGLPPERLKTVLYSFESAQKSLQIPSDDVAANDALAKAVTEIVKAGAIVPERITQRAIKYFAETIEADRLSAGNREKS